MKLFLIDWIVPARINSRISLELIKFIFRHQTQLIQSNSDIDEFYEFYLQLKSICIHYKP